MPKRTDIKKILVIGSGPIVIGSAAEFDYSGTQAALALKEEGYEVILVNPNPATFMTDKKMADKVYMEPLNVQYLEHIIDIERPDAILPTIGGQVGLNLAVKLDEQNILAKYNVESLGAPIESIKGAEDRETFHTVMEELGVPQPPSHVVNNVEDGIKHANLIGLPVVIRPSFTMGGGGGGFAENQEELEAVIKRGLQSSPVNEVLIEKSIKGFKEIEYEVMRDKNDTAIVVCNMENIDPVGVHTGDSMVVAPSLTLTNKQYQMLRDVSLKIIRRFGIEGGCNVQLALDAHSDQFYIIEINPRVSRSSALASKATGYPIAKISALIAIGKTLDEIVNPITKKTMASFEPSIDYIVSKLPRFPFDKFRSNESPLGTHMQATGETMSIGRNFEESFLKSISSLDGEYKFIESNKFDGTSKEQLLKDVAKPDGYRLWAIFKLFSIGATVDELYKSTQMNTYFLNKFKNIVDLANEVEANKGDLEVLARVKKKGFTDEFIAEKWNMAPGEIFDLRHKENIVPSYKMIDTIAGEFESKTNYLYSSYTGTHNEAIKTTGKKVIIVGSGPIRIGQGVEFDYSTTHSILSFKKLGYETIVVNNNPETVSTDFSIADKLYFEPITPEVIEEIYKLEKPEGVVLQFGGQTAINVAQAIESRGIPILGTSNDSIDLSEDRERFSAALRAEGIKQPKSAASDDLDKVIILAKEIGYPVLIRPSYVIGGKGMQVVTNEHDLKEYLELNVLDYKDNMILIDKYMPGKEIEVDAVSDGEEIFIPGIMEHIEKSGIHSGDSTTVFPSISLDEEIKEEIIDVTRKLARIHKVKGLMNIQFILYEGELFVIEVNLRSSRTIPFISKATDINVVDMAIQVTTGKKISKITAPGVNKNEYDKYFVKSPVFSFHKLHKVTDIALGPEMKSTGESIGIDKFFDKALYKSLLGANFNPLKNNKVIITVNDGDKDEAVEIATFLTSVGIKLYATPGTYKHLMANGIKVEEIGVGGKTADIIHLLNTKEIAYVINTPSNLIKSIKDAQSIRSMALACGVTSITSIRLSKQIAKLTARMKMLIEPAYK